MRRAFPAALALLCGLPLAAETHGAQKSPPKEGAPKVPGPKATKAPAPRRAADGPIRIVSVTRVEPTEVVPGEQVTVIGSGFDQGTVLLLGTEAPRLLEQSDTRIVFEVPDPDKQRPTAWSAPLYLVTPGQKVVNSAVTMQVLPRSSRVTRSAATALIEPFVLMTVVPLGRTEERRWPIDLDGAKGVRITVESSSGECEVTLEPEGSAPLVRATQGGVLKIEYDVRAMKTADGKPPLRAALILANDAEKPVPVRVGVQKIERKPIKALAP